MEIIHINENFWQALIAGAIIIAALVVAIVLIVKRFRKNQKSDPCSGCSADCGNCSFKQQFSEQQKKKS